MTKTTLNGEKINEDDTRSVGRRRASTTSSMHEVVMVNPNSRFSMRKYLTAQSYASEDALLVAWKPEERILDYVSKHTETFPESAEDPLDGKPVARITRKNVFVSPLVKFFTSLEPLGEALLDSFHSLDEAVTFILKQHRTATNAMLFVLGLYVLFYGTTFSTTHAFISALFKGGTERLGDNLFLLKTQLNAAKLAFESLERSSSEEIKSAMRRRKGRAILASISPVLVNEVIEDVWRAVLFAGATAKLHHAKIISLGLTLGDHLHQPVQTYVVSLFEDETEEEFHMWYYSFFMYLTYLSAIVMAFQIVPIIGVVATAVKGAHVIIASGKNLFGREIDGVTEDFVAISVAVLGIAVQLALTKDRPVPYVFLALFFPISLLENYLITFVKWM